MAEIWWDSDDFELDCGCSARQVVGGGVQECFINKLKREGGSLVEEKTLLMSEAKDQNGQTGWRS